MLYLNQCSVVHILKTVLIYVSIRCCRRDDNAIIIMVMLLITMMAMIPVNRSNRTSTCISFIFRCIDWWPWLYASRWSSVLPRLHPDRWPKTAPSSPGALDFEMEKILESWFFQESCLKVPRVQNRRFSIILYEDFFVIQDGVRRPAWICVIPRFWPM